MKDTRERTRALLCTLAAHPDSTKIAARALSADADQWDKQYALYELGKVMLGENRLDDAEYAAGELEWDAERIELQAEIASSLARQGQSSRALALLGEAEVAAHMAAFSAPWKEAEALRVVAQGMIDAGESAHGREIWRQAIIAAQRGEEGGDFAERLECGKVLWDIARDMAKAGERTFAFRVAESIAHDTIRAEALEMLAQLESNSTD
jgi:hypothetical protein